MTRLSIRTPNRLTAVAIFMALAVALWPLPRERAVAATQLDQQQRVVNEIFCMQPHSGSACYAGGAQTVTAGVSGKLVVIELLFARQDFTTTTKDLVVEIRDGGPTGALLATSNPVAAADVPILSAANWIRLTFPTPATVTAGQVFAIVVPSLPLSPDTDPAWGWGKASSDFYAGGVAFGGDSLGGWGPYVDGSDLAFVTFVDDGLPELPNTAMAGPLGYSAGLTMLIVLAAVAALRLLFVRRARRRCCLPPGQSREAFSASRTRPTARRP